MRIKSILSIMTACALLMSMAGCSQDQEPDKDEEKETEQADEFDAAACTKAYLDSIYKGDVSAYAQISGKTEEELNTIYEDNIKDLVSASLGENENAPGTDLVAPQLYQDYTDFWKNVLGNTKYQVTGAEKDGDAYKVSIDTEKMEFYTKLKDILPEKMEALYANLSSDSTDEDITSAYSQMMLESYQASFDQITYSDPESITVTLAKEDNIWTLSAESQETVDLSLLDLDVAANGFLDADPSEVQTESTPNQTYPENLDQVTSYKIGDTIPIQQDGQDIATFCINSVEVTDERSEFDESNPEKVVVINYTYQNLAHEDPLLYDQMSFQLLEGETVCNPYYLQDLIPADLAYKDGEAITASLSYGVSSSCQEVVVYVDGVQVDSPFQVSASLS